MANNNMMSNGPSGSRWTGKDYSDVQRAGTILQDQLLAMNAASMARTIKAWLTQHVPSFARSWGMIMSHMGPPGIATAHAKDGVITRAQAARNSAEAQANLEANRLQAATEESREELSAKDIQIDEIKRILAKAQSERETLALNVETNAQQSAVAAKAAEDLRKELDEKNDELLQANMREAIAQKQAEEEKELRERAEAQCRLAELSETYYLREAQKAQKQKRSLAQYLESSATAQDNESFNFSVKTSQIQMLIKDGKHAEAAEATENLNRQMVSA